MDNAGNKLNVDRVMEEITAHENMDTVAVGDYRYPTRGT